MLSNVERNQHLDLRGMAVMSKAAVSMWSQLVYICLLWFTFVS